MSCNDTPPFQIINVAEPEEEAVTVVEIKSFSKIDQDYVSNDTNLEIIRDSAIDKLQQALNLYFTEREVQIQFYSGECQLPFGPQPIDDAVIAVLKNDETTALDPDKYTVRGLNYKTIIIGSSECCSNITSWFYPIWGGYPQPWTWTPGSRDFYTVNYTTGFGSENNPLPKNLKHAILMLADYMIKEQGTTELDIPPAIMKIANFSSKNLIIQ